MNDRPGIALISLGCDKNLVESERMLGGLAGGNYAFSPNEEEADLIIINTCGFIQQAVDEAKEHITRALSLKDSGSCRWVVVTGCLAQRYKDALLKEFPQIDGLVTETESLAAVVSKLTGVEAGLGVPRVPATPGHYAYLKIAEGCDNACAYCAIPLIKGPFKSRPIADLVDEARALAEGGVKELVIVAQDTLLYGNDYCDEPRIGELLRELSRISGIEWIRLMYCYPERITDALIKQIAANPKICRYLDIPIQHSNTNVLQRMGRKTNEESLRKLITKLREAMPDIILRTTVMAGFPGETKQEFQSMLKFLDEMCFDRLGAFAYSREEGTRAYDMPEQLNEKTKNARRDRIMEQQARISLDTMEGHVGKTLRVLIDGWDQAAEVYYGRSYMDCPEADGVVYIRGADMQPGTFVNVLIEDAGEYDLYGVFVDD